VHALRRRLVVGFLCLCASYYKCSFRFCMTKLTTGNMLKVLSSTIRLYHDWLFDSVNQTIHRSCTVSGQRNREIDSEPVSVPAYLPVWACTGHSLAGLLPACLFSDFVILERPPSVLYAYVEYQ